MCACALFSLPHASDVSAASARSTSACCGPRRLRPRAKAPCRTRWLTRSGWMAAYAMATAPPCEIPRSGNRCHPNSATTASRSRTQASTENDASPTSRSDSPHPALVVTAEREVTRDFADQVTPDGTPRVVVEVREPVRRLHEWRAFASNGIGDADTVAAPAEPDPLGAMRQRPSSSLGWRPSRRSGSRARARS